MQSEKVEETRDGRGVRIFVGINPWGGRWESKSEREREISARRRASAPPSQRRRWAALALLLAPPPRSAALDLGEKVGNGRGRRRDRGPDAVGGAVTGQNTGDNEVGGTAAGKLGARGTVVDGPEPNRVRSAVVRRKLGAGRNWDQMRSSTSSEPDEARCSRRANWGSTRSWPGPRRARGRRRTQGGLGARRQAAPARGRRGQESNK